MAYLYRLISRLLLLLFFPVSSFALIPASPAWVLDVGYGIPMMTGASPTETCEAAAAWTNANWGGSRSGTLYPPVGCDISGLGRFSSYQSGLICPANSSLSGSNCVCSSGYVEQNGACVVPPSKCADLKGQPAYYRFDPPTSVTPPIGGSYCPTDGAASACGASVVGGMGSIVGGVKKWSLYHVEYTGSPCTPSTGGGGDATLTACKGTSSVLNGVVVCVPPSDRNVIQSGKTTTTSNPVAPGAAPGSSGTTTSSDSTECVGSKCTTTTTTTTTAADGTTSQTTQTKEQPKDDFCTSNPRASACVVSSLSAMPCAASDVCDGDAIQCAINAKAKATQCALEKTADSADTDVLTLAKAETGNRTLDLPGNSAVTLGSTSFDTSDAIGAAVSCIADKSVTVAGHVVSIPFSGVCVHLAMLGNVLLAVSFLLAGRIVIRG